MITPHGAHEVNLFATRGNATVVEVMPDWTDIPVYNRLAARTVWVLSRRLASPYPCVAGACAPLPAAHGACTRWSLCRKLARGVPCVHANHAALAVVLAGGEALSRVEDAWRARLGAAAA